MMEGLLEQPDDISPKFSFRGKMDRDKLLDAEIVTGKRSPKTYAELSKGMSYYEIKKKTELAVEVDNMPAVKGLALSNKFAVAEALSAEKGYKMIARRASQGEGSAPELFFMLRSAMSKRTMPMFRRLARQVILKTSMGITSRGLKGAQMQLVQFDPSSDQEFDVDATLENYMEHRVLTYDHIVAYEKIEKSKTGVLIFDTSGSLYGERFSMAALAVAVLAYHLAHDKFAVVLFNTKAQIIKHIDEKVRIDELINRILDSESAGYTNIAEALRYAGIELSKVKQPSKFGILITDGTFNRGGDPRKELKYFQKLHVLALPSKQEWGLRVCKDLARHGKGKHAQVGSYKEIPRLLMRLLRYT